MNTIRKSRVSILIHNLSIFPDEWRSHSIVVPLLVVTAPPLPRIHVFSVAARRRQSAPVSVVRKRDFRLPSWRHTRRAASFLLEVEVEVPELRLLWRTSSSRNSFETRCCGSLWSHRGVFVLVRPVPSPRWSCVGKTSPEVVPTAWTLSDLGPTETKRNKRKTKMWLMLINKTMLTCYC